jgi:hypothetical protein
VLVFRFLNIFGSEFSIRFRNISGSSPLVEAIKNPPYRLYIKRLSACLNWIQVIVRDFEAFPVEPQRAGPWALRPTHHERHETASCDFVLRDAGLLAMCATHTEDSHGAFTLDL